MAGKNQVTLTLAGDSTKLEKAFESVGASAKEMSSDVGRAGKSFDDVGESADKGETRILGAKDAVDGVATIMKGPGEQGIAAYLQGWADLSSGVANFIIPAAKAVITTGLVATKQKIAAVGAKAWAAAQWVLNAALSANPIGIVIVAIAALVAIFVVAWTRSQRFRQIVTGAFSSVVGWVRRNWPLLLGILTGPIGLAVVAIVKHKDRIIAAFKAIPTAIGAAFRSVGNAIRNAWNSTIGGKGFTIPDIPGVPGRGQRVEIPRLHSGGIVPGSPGSETLALLQAGERVIPAGGGGKQVVEIRFRGSLAEALRPEIRALGGNVQVALGR